MGTVFGDIEEPNIERIITSHNFGQSPPKGREKPYNYHKQQQQTTPQEITNEVTNEATSNHNIFQGINEATSNHNIFQGITEEAENVETINHNIFQRTMDEAGSETTPNPNIFQGIINDVESEITISQNILKELTNHPEKETTTSHNPSNDINQHQVTLKRYMDNNNSEGTSPKRPNINDEATDEEMIIDDMVLSPGWKDKYLTTATSPIKENHLKKLKQIINQKITPKTPTRRRTRSQDQKETPAKYEQNYKNSRTRSQDTKNKSINPEQVMNIIENKYNQGKTNIKGTQQNINVRVQRTNKSSNKGRNL